MTMSFLEKLKNLHSGPPAPPRRVDTSTIWSEEEHGDEEGDTYEVPPCERPTIKVQRQHVEENIYLGYPERTPQPAVPQRQALPPSRPAKRPPEPPPEQEDFYIDPSNAKFPEVNRKDKKLLPRKSPPAIPVPNHEEEVYLDPDEGQVSIIVEPFQQHRSGRESDVYLHHPPPARPPLPPNAVRIALPIVRHPSPFIMKPPVPGAKSNSLVTSDSVKAAPPPEGRSHTFPARTPPPAPNNKPPLPISLKEPKPSPPPPPSADGTAPGTPPGGQGAGLQNKDWFAGVCGRKTAEDALLRFNRDGSFLVRFSTAKNAQQPYTLVVLFNQKVYNIPVRFLKDSSSFVLGKEGKKNEELFSTLQDMISFHKYNPLLLIDSKSQAKNTTYLIHPVHP